MPVPHKLPLPFLRPRAILLLGLLGGCTWISDEDHAAWVDADGDGYTRDVDCDDDDENTGGPSTWYTDDDGDGYGTEETETSCAQPGGTTDVPGDCDDTDATVHPGAEEVCDGLDNDCDAYPDDEDDDVTGTSSWYADEDGDGYGDEDDTVERCDASAEGYIPFEEGDGTDCDDDDADTHPGAEERLDGVDNDCDGSADRLALTDAWAVLLGTEAGDGAGYAVDRAGDTDGDRIGDIVVGADSASGESGGSPGVAYVVRGPVSGTLDLSAADAILVGTSDGDDAGADVAGAGDVDLDGYADLLVGAWHNSDAGSNAGAAYLVHGPVSGELSLSEAHATLLGAGDSHQAGKPIASAGDTDSDGHPDLLVGSATASSDAGDKAGVVYLVSGTTSGTTSLPDAMARLEGHQGGAMAGRSTAGAGDVDGDGYHDVIVGATGASDNASGAGAVFLVKGPVTGTFSLSDADLWIQGEGTNDNLGRRVAGGADADGDGYPDLLYSCHQCDHGGEDAGTAYLLYGSALDSPEVLTASDADAALIGDDAGDEVGSSVDFVGDLDGDGADEILAGARRDDEGGEDAGAAWLLLGPVTGTWSPSEVTALFTGTESEEAGSCVSGAGDIDGDGTSDILVGAPGNSDNADSAGAAYLLVPEF